MPIPARGRFLTLNKINSDYDAKASDLIQLDDEILYQEFALYKPIYNFATSEMYKVRLDTIRQKQKDMIKGKSAVGFSANWTVDGSKAKGTKMTNDNIKQILRTFNTECENAIDRVKFNNVESMKNRIIKSFESLNKLNTSVKVALLPKYLNLKLDELNLAVEYAMKKQDEKEEQKRIRDELREQAKLEKEIEEARKRIRKEQTHFSSAMSKLDAQIAEANTDELKADLEHKKAEILDQLTKLDAELQEVDYREKMPKAGYVYVISNIGAFGEDIYKIGMTRRLEPQERIDELSSASVPFKFDIHALIFSEDAPKLESALHQAFDNNKVNMMNSRKEFFKVSLDEVKKVIRENFDKTVEFTDLPEAADYRQSTKLYEHTAQL